MRLPAPYLKLDPRVIPVRVYAHTCPQRGNRRERGKKKEGRRKEGKKERKRRKGKKLPAEKVIASRAFSLSLSKRRNISDSLARSSTEERVSIKSRHDSRNGTFELGYFNRIYSFLPFLDPSVDWLEKIEKNIAREKERERDPLTLDYRFKGIFGYRFRFTRSKS